MEEVSYRGGVEVRCISSDTIKSATQSDSTQRLELTPWDLRWLALHPMQSGLLFHKPYRAMWISDLKASLALVLHHFFPLAGRLGTESHDDGTVSVFIDCNNAGVEFIHAQADHLTLSDIIDQPLVPQIVHDFFTLNASINYDGRSQPLLSVQVTQLLDGVFIGCTMNHTVADGSSFWNFINSWSEICRSKSDKISRPPNFKRWFLNQSDLPVRLLPATIQNSIQAYIMPPQLQERLFHFAPHNIAKLKAKANLDNNSKHMISSLQAVLAHVWVGVTRARKMDSSEETQCRVAIGNRGRLISPPLLEEYFGNSFGSGVARAKAGVLMEEGIGFAAGLLNQVVSSHSNDNICNAWENWVREPLIIRFHLDDSKTLMVVSSPRFDIYGNDFGWGCPIGVRSGSGSRYDGKLSIYPCAIKGSMEIKACLLSNTMTTLGEDSSFMEFVGT